eukprot:CAMPEP_0196690530 /NCGR_PEP_ID=MMETSP1090-20130531/19948_1 /TAXON_ID=37098 /ORGANISM="Isochrysis sp, Strain CCMP1244" /LENGTH=224 /DNA_ID=CAMNT_0042029641 /DNA_START=327 /DNA_END=1002 /DNA_ORIENTATION=-
MPAGLRAADKVGRCVRSKVDERPAALEHDGQAAQLLAARVNAHPLRPLHRPPRRRLCRKLLRIRQDQRVEVGGPAQSEEVTPRAGGAQEPLHRPRERALHLVPHLLVGHRGEEPSLPHKDLVLPAPHRTQPPLEIGALKQPKSDEPSAADELQGNFEPPLQRLDASHLMPLNLARGRRELVRPRARLATTLPHGGVPRRRPRLLRAYRSRLSHAALLALRGHGA